MSDGDEEIRPVKQCSQCDRVLPADRKHFVCVPGCTTSFQSVCRKCRAANKRKAELAKIEAKAVDTFVKRTISGGANIPHTAELLEAMMVNFGGVNGFASLAMKQYWDAAPGSRIRSQVLEMVTKLATQNTEQGGARKPISLYTEDELEAEIDQRIQNAISLQQRPRIIDVHPESAGLKQPPGHDAPVESEHLGVPARRAAELADRIGREADGVPSPLPAYAEAVGLPPGHGQ